MKYLPLIVGVALILATVVHKADARDTPTPQRDALEIQHVETVRAAAHEALRAVEAWERGLSRERFEKRTAKVARAYVLRMQRIEAARGR